MSEQLKNVVVIGLGLAGAPLATALAAALPSTHRVVAISSTDYGFYPIGALRASVVPGFETSITAPLNVFPKGSRHVVLGGTSVVKLGAHSVTLDRAHSELGIEIAFDSAIIATGSSYAFPCRTTGEESIAEVSKTFKELQKQVADSKRILIVGGGPTGIEMAGELQFNHPDLLITLCHSGASFYPEPEWNKKLGASLLRQLQAKGVDVIFNARVDTQGLKTGPIPSQSFTAGGRTFEADFLYIAYGCTPNSSVATTLGPDLLDDASRIKVLPTLQLPSFPHIFAIGDVNDVPETKLSVNAQGQVPTIVKNVVELLKGKPATKQHKPAAAISLVTVGPNGGAGQVFGFVVGAWLSSTLKSSTLFVSKFKGFYSIA